MGRVKRRDAIGIVGEGDLLDPKERKTALGL